MTNSGNEPSLPQKQSNEPQIGGLRRIEKYQNQRKGNRMSHKIIRVVGVVWEGRQDIIAKMRGDESVQLIAEPDNPHDSRAVAVHVTLRDGTDAHVGYLPRAEAPGVAPYLDTVMVEIRQITGGFELQDGSGDLANYGIELDLRLPENKQGDEDDIPF